MKIDTTRPNIGRIYDYLLGGQHNYEADRQAADAIVKIVPSLVTSARQNRWFLQLVATRWAEEGRTQVLDLGSGLPTQGHFNDFLPDARIMFTDNDELSIAYGSELLKDKPNMRCTQVDLRSPEPLFEEAGRFFDLEKTLAFGLFGLIYFFTDAEVRNLGHRLHALCRPGSALAATYFEPPPEGGPAEQAMKTYMKMTGAQLLTRTPEQVAELFAPWRIVRNDLVENWLETQHLLSDEDRRTNQFRLYGLIAAK